MDGIFKTCLFYSIYSEICFTAVFPCVAVRQRSPPCRLPDWLRAHGSWLSLSRHLELQVGLHNVTLRHLHGHHRHQLHQLQQLHDLDNDLQGGPQPSHTHLHHHNVRS